MDAGNCNKIQADSIKGFKRLKLLPFKSVPHAQLYYLATMHWLNAIYSAAHSLCEPCTSNLRETCQEHCPLNSTFNSYQGVTQCRIHVLRIFVINYNNINTKQQSLCFTMFPWPCTRDLSFKVYPSQHFPSSLQVFSSVFFF